MTLRSVILIAVLITLRLCSTPLICELCGDRWKPVCSKRGITYYNKCHAICYLDFGYIEGECMNECECLDEWKPVCGVDGNTY